VTVKEVPTADAAFVLQSVAGLAAKAALRGGNRDMVWYPIGHPAYLRWHEEMLRQTKAQETTLPDVWAVVERFRRAGIVKGYVLFRKDAGDRRLHQRGPYDPSANVATVLAARLGAVMVSEDIEHEARARGLQRLADARGLTEEQCYEHWAAQCSDSVLALVDPRVPHCRAEAIALDAFVLATHGPLLERALARIRPDSPILGWGAGDEFQLTEPVSRWALWQSATNWCLNLPVLSTEQVGSTLPASSIRARQRSLWDLTWEDGVHYTSFLMTDGDNVQWLMGDFQFGAEQSWWNSPARGKFPMGWGACLADVAQLCPYALRNLIRTASPRDDLVLMGGGYYYPDLFGKSRNSIEPLRLHARRIRGYLRLTGTSLLHMNAAKWDSPEAIRAYTVFAEEIPELQAILMVQYAPYTAGKGRVLWVRRRDGTELPVISARFAIWAHSPFPDDGPPAEIAAKLNAEPRLAEPATSDAENRSQPAEVPGFSWVTVHCWSWFKNAPDDAAAGAEETDQATAAASGAKRGLEPVAWCVRRLDPHVRVVTPTELALLMNLRLRPEQTLRRAVAELHLRLRTAQPARRSAVRGFLDKAREALAKRNYRQAFLAGKNAARVLGVMP